MDNSTISEIKDKGIVLLKMTSGKKVKLHNVLYVHDILKNLIFEIIMSLHDFNMVFEA